MFYKICKLWILFETDFILSHLLTASVLISEWRACRKCSYISTSVLLYRSRGVQLRPTRKSHWTQRLRKSTLCVSATSRCTIVAVVRWRVKYCNLVTAEKNSFLWELVTAGIPYVSLQLSQHPTCSLPRFLSVTSISRSCYSCNVAVEMFDCYVFPTTWMKYF